jgi:hypothetical protein
MGEHFLPGDNAGVEMLPALKYWVITFLHSGRMPLALADALAWWSA